MASRKNSDSSSIEKIALITGVSKTAVSFILNGKAEQHRISKMTAEKVEAAAVKYDYTPNLNARNLRLKCTRTIGLVIPDFENPFFAQLAKEIEKNLRSKSYQVLLAISDDDEKTEIQAVRNLTARQADALMIASVIQSCDSLAETYQSRLPAVFIDRRIEGRNVSWIQSDSYSGALQVSDALLNKAEKRSAAAYIGTDPLLSTSRDRLKGFKESLRRHSVKVIPSLIIQSGSSFKHGYDAAARIAKENKKLPQYLFTGCIGLLEGVLAWFKENAGDEISATRFGTFDDHPLLQHASVPVISCRQDTKRIAEVSVEHLLASLSGTVKPLNCIVPPQLIIR